MISLSNLTKAPAFTVGLSIAGAAHAQLNVVDSNGVTLGVYVGDDGNNTSFLARQYNGKFYLLDYGRSGLVFNAYFVFPTSDCSGQRYLIATDEEPAIAAYDNLTLWAPSSDQTQWIVMESADYGGACYAFSRGWLLVAPAVALDLMPSRWRPPFAVKAGQ
jgi:hypothetical protein